MHGDLVARARGTRGEKEANERIARTRRVESGTCIKSRDAELALTWRIENRAPCTKCQQDLC